jgi:hypothetical protein
MPEMMLARISLERGHMNKNRHADAKIHIYEFELLAHSIILAA